MVNLNVSWNKNKKKTAHPSHPARNFSRLLSQLSHVYDSDCISSGADFPSVASKAIELLGYLEIHIHIYNTLFLSILAHKCCNILQNCPKMHL